MSISLTTISQQVGVSRSAVSHVLNGRGHMVSAVTRERIVHAVEAAGYHRNALVRSLKASRTHVIGIIVPEIISLFSEIVQSVEQEAKSLNLQCFICQSHNQADLIEKGVTTLREYRVDGILIVPANGKAVWHIYRTLVDQKFPFVVADVDIPGIEVPYVGNDNRQMGKLAAEHLLRLRHRRIAFIKGYPGSANAQERLDGYRQALKSAGIRFDLGLVTGENYTFEEGRAAIASLLEKKVEFTALIASSDSAALGAMQALADRGLRVPEDVSIVGCGNLDISAMVSPSLSTIDQNPKEIGRKALEILVNQIEGKRGKANRALIPSRLIIRQSSQTIPENSVNNRVS